MTTHDDDSTIRSHPLSPEVPTENTWFEFASGAKEEESLKVGRYRLIRLIGSGGMGSVYEAEQKHPDRRVALKMIRAGKVTAESIRRFERESQALARLRHPGIAQVYDAGMSRDHHGATPFFTMELIEGLPLLEHLSTKKPNRRERLELFLALADAIQHAHAAGVIHRDLKPANILVDQSNRPRIVDFGVARLTDSTDSATLATQAGEIVGTLNYMAPEQMMGEQAAVDARVDVYALGVTLYEMLTGRLPLQLSGRPLLEAVTMVREVEPPRLGTIDSSLAGDIETIVAKALEKEPHQRYLAASDFAQDIQRHLRHEPILARPPSVSYTLLKLIRRHRVLVIGAALVILALACGIAGTLMGLFRERAAQEQATKEAKNAQDALDLILAGVWAAHPDETGSARGLTALLDAWSKKLDGRFSAAPAIEVRIRNTIAACYEALGRVPEAQAQIEAATRIGERALPESHADRLATDQVRASLLAATGDLEGSRKLLELTFAQCQKHLSSRHERTLAIAQDFARVSAMAGHPKEAERVLRILDSILAQLAPPENKERLEVAIALADALSIQDRYAEVKEIAEPAYQRITAQFEPGHPLIISVAYTLALAEDELGHGERALELVQSTVAAGEKSVGARHPGLFDLRRYGVQLAFKLNNKEALRLAAQPMASLATSPELGHHVATPTSLNTVGNILLLSDEFALAEETLRAGVTIARGLPELDPKITVALQGRLARAQFRTEHFDDALKSAVVATELAAKHPTTFSTYQTTEVPGTLAALAYENDDALRVVEQLTTRIVESLGGEHELSRVLKAALNRVR